MEHLVKESFKQKIFDYDTKKEWAFQGDKPVIIDFYASWCGPCKMVAPVLEDLANDYSGKIDIYKVDTEDQQELAALFQIRSIPSILFIPTKGQPTTAAGAMSKEQFKDAINDVLKVSLN